MNVVISLHLIGFLLGSWGIGWLYRGTFAIEDTVVTQVAASRRPIRSGDHLFFLNLPLGAWYVVPAYENEKGLHDLHGHALSLAPGLLPIENRSRLTQLDDHTLRVEAVGAEYFSGPEGAMTLQMLNLSRDFDAVTTIEADLYTVTLEPGQNGARAMTFRFGRPLNDPTYHFFYGSAQQLAYAIEFPMRANGSVVSGGGLSP